ncbi:MAG: hypothetical protein ABL921_30330 [Pirellula sp.]
MKKSFGVLLIVASLGVFGYWIDRSYFHPTHSDKQRLATIADTGSDPGDSRKGILVVGVALMAAGSYLMKASRH